MNVYSRNSRANLVTARKELQMIGPIVLTVKDHSVIKGHRGKDEQNAAYIAGASQLKWPNGKHNGLPSDAIDVRTYPNPPSLSFDGDPDEMTEDELRDEVKQLRRRFREQPLREEQCYLLGIYKGVGTAKGVPIRTGCDWGRDGNVFDNSFDDFFHVERDK